MGGTSPTPQAQRCREWGNLGSHPCLRGTKRISGGGTVCVLRFRAKFATYLIEFLPLNWSLAEIISMGRVGFFFFTGVPSPPSSHPPPIKTTQVSLVKRPHNVEEAEKQQQQQERKRRLENITRLLLLLLRNLIETVTRSARHHQRDFI